MHAVPPRPCLVLPTSLCDYPGIQSSGPPAVHRQLGSPQAEDQPVAGAESCLPCAKQRMPGMPWHAMAHMTSASALDASGAHEHLTHRPAVARTSVKSPCVHV